MLRRRGYIQNEVVYIRAFARRYFIPHMIEDGMAATRKSAKRRTGKRKATGAKRATSKRATGSKRSSTKSASRSRRARVSVPKLKRKARRGLGMAKEGLDTVRAAGGKVWKRLKATTTQLMDK